jgi:hypothetical protein
VTMGPMAVIDTLRSVGSVASGRGVTLNRRTQAIPFAAGLVTGALSAGTVVLVVVGVVLSTGTSTIGWDQSVGTGAALWLLGGGVRLDVGQLDVGQEAGAATVAFTPLLLTAFLVGVCALVADRTLPRRGPQRGPGALWVVGYAVAALLTVALTSLAPPEPVSWSVLLPVLGVPVAGVAVVWARRGVLHKVTRRRAPRILTRAARPAAEGTLLLVALGGLLVAAAVAVQIGRVSHVTSELDAGGAGTIALWVAQVLALPNLALWGVSFMAGPGFSVVEGAHVGWAGAESGLMPLVPVLGALPSPGSFPWVVHLAVLGPVGVGVVVGWRSLRAVPRLSPTSTKAGVVLVAAAGVGLATAALDAVAGGSLGGSRLADVGAPAFTLGLAVAVEVGLGALVPVLREWWTLRR